MFLFFRASAPVIGVRDWLFCKRVKVVDAGVVPVVAVYTVTACGGNNLFSPAIACDPSAPSISMHTVAL